MYRPETKIEKEVELYATNQVHENQRIGLTGEFMLALSNGPNRVGVSPPPSTRVWKEVQFPKRCVL
jgi:hypothetical protein